MEEGQERIKAPYGENFDYLVKIKSKYDLENLFHANQNIKPEVSRKTPHTVI
jgi:hypothetical protein